MSTLLEDIAFEDAKEVSKKSRLLPRQRWSHSLIAWCASWIPWKHKGVVVIAPPTLQTSMDRLAQDHPYLFICVMCS